MGKIVDFSWGRPGVAALKAADVSVVIRYLTRDTTGKALTKAEADSYRAAGIQIIGVFQDGAARVLGGYEAGKADGQFALAQAKGLGFQGYGAIYFAADFDARTAAHLNAIEQYFVGVGEVIPLANVGVYGDYDTMERIRERNLATYFWQAGASSWSSGRRFPGVDLVQLVGGPTIGGASVDYNERVNPSSVGEWQRGDPGMAAADNPNQNRADIEAELNEATAEGFHDFDEMFDNPKSGIVALLRAIYNAIGLNRGTAITDQVGLVGLAVSSNGADLLKLAADVQQRQELIITKLDQIIRGLGALGNPPSTPLEGALDPAAFADAVLDAIVERLSGGLAPRQLLLPATTRATGQAASASPSGPSTAPLAGNIEVRTGPITPVDMPVIDPSNPLGLGQEPLGGWGQD